MNRKEVVLKLSEHLRSKAWLSALELKELGASVSHWLQNPALSVPFFSNSMRNESCLLLNRLQKENRGEPESDHDSEYLSTSIPKSPYLIKFDFLSEDVPFPPPKSWDFTFIDLFAGIGGFRIAFQNAGGKCVFTSEWDKHAKETYEANFGEYPYGDIREIVKSEIPDHDVLCAGFPCQPFSLAGVSKKNSLGRKHGFEDQTQGTLFFEIKEILRIKRPKAFMLENVKNLLGHDKGKTFEVIRHALEDQLGYSVAWEIVDGSKWVPQHRERIFIVGFDPLQVPVEKDAICIPKAPQNGYKYPQLKDIIVEGVQEHTLGPGTWNTLERHKAHHESRGNGFGYGLHRVPIKRGTITRTISARYHKDGAEVLIEQKNDRPRRLTISEAMQLQGFDPKRFIFPVSNTQAYKQIGNSVVVPAVQATAEQIASKMRLKRDSL